MFVDRLIRQEDYFLFIASKNIGTLFAGAMMVAASTFTAAPAFAENPFHTLAGTWSGQGTAKFDNGKKESLRCKGYYTNASSTDLGLSIRCANASSKLELRAKLNYSNGKVSGNWEERTYNQSGTVSGKASGNRIRLAIHGGIQGSMSVAVSGRTHSVVVSTAGPTLTGINISMAR